jgi:hypothetical protein
MIILEVPTYNAADGRMWAHATYSDGAIEELHDFAALHDIDTRLFDPNWQRIVGYSGHRKEDNFALTGSYWLSTAQWERLKTVKGLARLEGTVVRAMPILFKWYQEHIRPRPLVPYRVAGETRSDEELLTIGQETWLAWRDSPERQILIASIEKWIAENTGQSD